MRALWLPYGVDDPAAAAALFVDHFGLSIVDGWPGGVVLRVLDDVYLEFAVPGEGAPAPVAVELASRAAVDATHRRLSAPPGLAAAGAGVRAPDGVAPGGAATAPRVFARGHYGFDAPAPGMGRVMVWCR